MQGRVKDPRPKVLPATLAHGDVRAANTAEAFTFTAFSLEMRIFDLDLFGEVDRDFNAELQ